NRNHHHFKRCYKRGGVFSSRPALTFDFDSGTEFHIQYPIFSPDVRPGERLVRRVECEKLHQCFDPAERLRDSYWATQSLSLQRVVRKRNRGIHRVEEWSVERGGSECDNYVGKQQQLGVFVEWDLFTDNDCSRPKHSLLDRIYAPKQ